MRLSTQVVGIIGIFVGLAGIPMGLWLDPSAGLLMAAAALLCGIGGLARRRQESASPWSVYGALIAGLLTLVIFAVKFIGALSG